MKLGPKGRKLIKSFEQLRLTAYNTDGAGVWTIGWGHTSRAGPPKVFRGMTITRKEADAILARDLAWAERAVNELVTVDIQQEQYDAMVSLVFNIGVPGFRRSSVLRHTNARRWAQAARAFALWNKAKGRVLPGLIRRRAAEAALYAEAQNREKLAEAEQYESHDVEQQQGKPMWQSKTAFAGLTNVAGGAAVVTSTVAQTKGDLDVITDGMNWMHIGIGALAVVGIVIMAAGGFVIYDRWLKSTEEGV